MVYLSSWLGRAPFTGKTRVRIPYRLQNYYRLLMAGNWFFKPGDAGSSPVDSTNIGMDYGDSRVCKTLAGEFESLTSHKITIVF